MMRSVSLDLQSVDDAAHVSKKISAALSEAKVVHFRSRDFCDTSLRDWDEIACGIGRVARTGEDGVTGLPNGDIWTDVRYDPALQHTFRHSNTAQPLHTDDAYLKLEDSCNYVLFLIEKEAEQGGQTYFVDAAELADYVHEIDSDLFARLTTVPVTFAKREIAGKTSPVLKVVDGDWEVNWNYYNVDLRSSPEVLAMREQFQTLLSAPETHAKLAYGFRLGKSEGVVWHDRRVLHGRTAFTASQAGDRIIWKCGIY